MSDAGPIGAVFLDLDATLLEENYVVVASVAACRQIAREHPELDAEALARANYEVWMRYWPEIEHDWILGTLTTDELRTETWRRTLVRLGSDDEAIVARVATVHRGFELAEYRPFEDVLPTLDTLRRLGVRLVVVTNGASDTQREKLDVMDITRRVDAIVVSAEVGVAKPDPAIFEAALAASGVRADRAAHVGDSLKADVGGALASGVRAIWLNREGAELLVDAPRPDHVIRSLDELPTLLSFSPLP
jgi:putative hydrolase of the HAD superfamily